MMTGLKSLHTDNKVKNHYRKQMNQIHCLAYLIRLHLFSLPLLNVYHDRMLIVRYDVVCVHTFYSNSFSGLIYLSVIASDLVFDLLRVWLKLFKNVLCSDAEFIIASFVVYWTT